MHSHQMKQRTNYTIMWQQCQNWRGAPSLCSTPDLQASSGEASVSCDCWHKCLEFAVIFLLLSTRFDLVCFEKCFFPCCVLHSLVISNTPQLPLFLLHSVTCDSCAVSLVQAVPESEKFAKRAEKFSTAKPAAVEAEKSNKRAAKFAPTPSLMSPEEEAKKKIRSERFKPAGDSVATPAAAAVAAALAPAAVPAVVMTPEMAEHEAKKQVRGDISFCQP